MSTIHDLRATLDREAATVHETTGVTATDRVSAVRGRARVVRRRRAAGGALAVAVVVGAVAVSIGPPEANDPPVAERTVLGLDAPPVVSAQGWTYRFQDARGEASSDRVDVSVDGTDAGVLVTWATTGAEQAVEVLLDGETYWTSETADFADHVVVPEGFAGRVSVTGEEPGVVVATYAVDGSRLPAGPDGAGVVLRETTGDRTLIAGEVAAAGATELAVDYVVPARAVELAWSCDGLPSGAAVHLQLADGDGDVTIDSCQRAADPALDQVLSLPGGRTLSEGDEEQARIWVTDGMDGPRLDPEDHPGARLALGVYAPGADRVDVVAGEEPVVVESYGHTWRVRSVLRDARGRSVQLSGDGPWLATAVADIRGRGGVRVRTDDEVLHRLQTRAQGRVALPLLLVQPGTERLQLDVTGERVQVRDSAVVVYERVD